jgi:hypothetical protein
MRAVLDTVSAKRPVLFRIRPFRCVEQYQTLKGWKLTQEKDSPEIASALKELTRGCPASVRAEKGEFRSTHLGL